MMVIGALVFIGVAWLVWQAFEIGRRIPKKRD